MGQYIKKTFSQMVVDSYQRAQCQDLRVEEISDDKCLVVNVDNNTMYNVWMDADYVTFCDCPHHTYRNVPCKHMFTAADFFRKTVG